jgi:hypothetical protein
MKAIEFLEKTYTGERHAVREMAVCKDGFRISIQGGTNIHYCSPRETCNMYDNVELGFPSEKDDLILEYAEDEEDLTGTVYGYVPIEIVEDLIEKHGGIINK